MLIRPPGVAGCPAILECRTTEIRQLTLLDGQSIDTWLVIGEVLAVQLRQDCIVDGVFRTELANPIVRAGYADEYWEIRTGGKFLMER